jgi:hypothetical protein
VRSREAAGDQNVCRRAGKTITALPDLPGGSFRPRISRPPQFSNLRGQELRHDEVVKERLRTALSCVDEEAEGIKPTRRLLVLGPNKRLAVYPKRQDDRGIGRGDALDSQLVLLARGPDGLDPLPRGLEEPEVISPECGDEIALLGRCDSRM